MQMVGEMESFARIFDESSAWCQVRSSRARHKEEALTTPKRWWLTEESAPSPVQCTGTLLYVLVRYDEGEALLLSVVQTTVQYAYGSGILSSQ